jgi:proline iminopeptidase
MDDGALLHTTTQGRGRPVVLCHGGPGGTDTLGGLATMLSGETRVHRYEQRACGRSSGRPPFSMARWIADLEALRRHWSHPRWIVGGHSFGAGLALAYALEHPECTEAVIFVSCKLPLHGHTDWNEEFRRRRLERIPTASRERFLELRRRRDGGEALSTPERTELRVLAMSAEFADPLVAGRMRADLVAELRAVNEQVNQQLGADFARYFGQKAALDRIRALDAPVLVVHGEEDPRPAAAAQALVNQLRHGELVILPGTSHFPFLEAPEALGRLIRRFVASLPLEGSRAG